MVSVGHGTRSGAAAGRIYDAAVAGAEVTFGVRLLVVIARNGLAHRLIVGVVIVLDVVYLVAVVVIGDVGCYVGLIMTKVLGRRLVVVGGEVTPVVGRRPALVARAAQVVVHSRRLVVNGLNDIGIAVDIRRTDNLHVGGGVVHFHYQRCHVLVDIGSQNGLDNEYVGIALQGLHHAQIIHVTIAVQVEVGYHVVVGVQDLLELLYRTGLCEGGAYCLQVQIERDVAGYRGNLNGSGGRVLAVRGGDGGCGGGLRNDDRRLGCRGRGCYHSSGAYGGGGRSHRDDTRKAACAAQRSCCQCE